MTRPLRWNPSDIGRYMLFFGPVSSLFDLTAFAVLWWVFDASSAARQGLFQSGWFVLGLLTQALAVHLLRTARLPFVQSRAALPLTLETLAIMVIALWLPQGALATATNYLYIRRHGWQ